MWLSASHSLIWTENNLKFEAKQFLLYFLSAMVT